MSTICSAVGSLTKYKIVGTSTNSSTSCGSRTKVHGGMSSTKILGTSITCSAIRKQRIEATKDVHQLFSHQRHRNIERRQERRAVTNLFHCVPLDPLPRPDASEAVRPRPGGRHIFDVK